MTRGEGTGYSHHRIIFFEVEVVELEISVSKVTGCWLLRYQMQDARCRMPDAEYQMQNARCRIPDAGCQIKYAGCKI